MGRVSQKKKVQTARTIESTHSICYLVRRTAGLTKPILSATHTIIGDISGIKTIAVGKAIREIIRLKKSYGKGRWRKLKVLQLFGCKMGRYAKLNCIGTKRMVSAEGKPRSNTFFRSNTWH